MRVDSGRGHGWWRALLIGLGLALVAPALTATASEVPASSTPAGPRAGGQPTSPVGLSSAQSASPPWAPEGRLRVTTVPAVPSQILLDGNIADTWGLNWTQVAVGTHEVCFSDVPGFMTPPCQTVSVAKDATTTIHGDFAQNGYLHVTTSPATDVQINVDGIPRNNWGLFTDLPPGAHQVCYFVVGYFTPPPCESVTITAGSTTSITAVISPGDDYVQEVYSDSFLRVTTDPPLPGQITVDGHPADRWGLNWLRYPEGYHTICWSHVEGYTEPACLTGYANAGETYSLVGKYQQRGFLKISTDPAGPGRVRATYAAAVYVAGQDDWGVFTDVPVPPVPYEVCVRVLADFAPTCSSVQVVAGATTNVVLPYAQPTLKGSGPWTGVIVAHEKFDYDDTYCNSVCFTRVIEKRDVVAELRMGAAGIEGGAVTQPYWESFTGNWADWHGFWSEPSPDTRCVKHASLLTSQSFNEVPFSINVTTPEWPYEPQFQVPATDCNGPTTMVGPSFDLYGWKPTAFLMVTEAFRKVYGQAGGSNTISLTAGLSFAEWCEKQDRPSDWCTKPDPMPQPAGSAGIYVRLTQLPDQDADGIPDSSDAKPLEFDPVDVVLP